MKHFLIPLALLCPSVALSETLAVYHYEGQPFFCPDPTRDECNSVPTDGSFAFTATFSADLDLLPGRSLSGAVVSAEVDWGYPFNGWRYAFESPAGALLFDSTDDGEPDSPRDIDFGPFTFGGSIRSALEGVAYTSTARLVFDDDANIVAWSASGFQGGSNDFAMFTGGDRFASGERSAPGRWVKQPPAPVPLPAAGLLLTGAVAMMMVGARRVKTQTKTAASP